MNAWIASLARQRHDIVDVQDRRGCSTQLELDRLVVDEAGRRVHLVGGQRGALSVVGVVDDLEVLGREPD